MKKYWLFQIMYDVLPESWRIMVEAGVAAQNYSPGWTNSAKNTNRLKKMQPGDSILAAFKGHRFAGYGTLTSEFYQDGPSLRIPNDEGETLEFAERFDCDWTVLPFERNPPERNPPYLDCHDLKGKGFHVDQLVGCCTTEIDKDTFDGIKRRLDQAGARRLSTSASVLDTVKADLDSFRIEEEYVEGTPKTRFTNYYERNPKLRTAAIDFYGTRCMACGFDFGKYYGERGVGFIEVHHLRQVSTFRKRTKVDPQTDMAVVCSNCHRMIHRRKDRVLSLDDLKAKIRHAREFRKSRHN